MLFASTRPGHGDLLEQPAIAVRVAERGERGVTAPLRIRAAERRLSRSRTVEYFAHVDTAIDELGARCLDVGHHEIESLCRAPRSSAKSAPAGAHRAARVFSAAQVRRPLTPQESARCHRL